MCRTANGWDINGMGQTKDGRGNVCPVSIILPTIAMEAKEMCRAENETDIDAFMFLLSCKINQAKDTLIDRFEYICSQSPKAATFMYENGTMEGYVPEEGIRSALKHGTLAIGQLGLAECLQILIGKDHTTKEGMELAKKIEQLFKDKCAEFKTEWHFITEEPTNDEITEKMLKIAKQKLNRELTDDEKDTILKFNNL